MRGGIGKEIALVYLAVAAATYGLTRLRAVAFLADYVHLAVGGVFLLTALRLAQREEQGLERYGIALGGLLGPAKDDEGGGPFGIGELLGTIRRGFPEGLRETLIAVGLAAVIFPPFAVGFAWYHGAEGELAWSLPDDFGSFALAQIVVVALPEEAFFRGYVQTRLEDLRGKGSPVRVDVLVMQAALFAIVHLADHNPARLAVFFPGLLFGLVRAWRGGIGACIVLHALSNVFSDFLVRAWLH